MVPSLYCCRWNYRKKLETYDQLLREQHDRYSRGQLPASEYIKKREMEIGLQAIEENMQLSIQEILFHRGECIHFMRVIAA